MRRGVPPQFGQRTFQAQRSTFLGTMAGRMLNAYPVQPSVPLGTALVADPVLEEDPLPIPAPAVWYRGDGLSSNATTWLSHLGYGPTLYRFRFGDIPVRISGLNGQPGAQWPGGGFGAPFLKEEAAPILPLGNGVTQFFVCDPATSVGFGIGGTSFAGVDGHGDRWYTQTMSPYNAGLGTPNYNTWWEWEPGSGLDGGTVVEWTHGPTAENTLETLRINGASVDTVDEEDDAPGPGALDTLSNPSMVNDEGAIYEFICYTRLLSGAELTQVRTYLSTRYGVTA